MRGGGYDEINTILKSDGKNYIYSHPFEYLGMSFLDFISLNSPVIPKQPHWANETSVLPMFANDRHQQISNLEKVSIILVLRAIWYIFIGLAIYGMIKSIRHWEKTGWLILLVVYINLIYSAVHAIPRYALPIYPFYILFALAGLSYLLESRMGKLLSSITSRYT